MLAKLNNTKNILILGVALVVVGGAGATYIVLNQTDAPKSKATPAKIKYKVSKYGDLGSNPTADQVAAQVNSGNVQELSPGSGKFAVAQAYLDEKSYDKAAASVSSLAKDASLKRKYTCDIMIFVYAGKNQTNELKTAVEYCVGQLKTDTYKGKDGPIYQNTTIAKTYIIGNDKTNAKKYFDKVVEIIDADPSLKNSEDIITIYDYAKNYN